SIAASFRSIIASNADEETLLVMSEGANFEAGSSLDRLTVGAIENSPLVRRDPEGPLASFEFTRPISVARKDGGDFVNLNVRGVGPAAYRVRDNFALVEGRLVEPGRFELISGRAAQQQFAGLDIGDSVTIAGTAWEVVGIFENNASATESELWADIVNLQSVFRLGTLVQSGRVKLLDPAGAEAFTEQLNTDPQVSITARNEAQYYEESSQGFLGV